MKIAPAAVALLLLAWALPAGADPGPDDAPDAADAAADADAAAIYTSDVPFTVHGPIDAAVAREAERRGIPLAPLCSDAVFLRRVTLDTLGVLPTAAEARAFLADDSPTKRTELIDRLLAREEFADCWALRWCDLLRVKAEFPINLWPNAAKAYHRWIRDSLRENVPYDRFARELLTASGSNFRVPQVNFYRAVQNREPETLARAAALTFMGVRAERWEPARLQGLAVCFARVGFKRTREWKEEIVFFDALETTAAPEALLPDGMRARLSADEDPREVFADWLIRAENPWFARNAVNRIWCWLLGRGITHAPDDVRPDNPPSNPALLDALARELVESGYDLRHVIRAVLTSSTYQLASISPADSVEAAEAAFACTPIRRLDAEVLIDAICQVTGTAETYASLIPEPFTIVPADVRAVALPDGSITSPFLELFGRPSRDTGLAAERSNRITAAQRLHLLNSSHIRQKIEASPTLRPLLRKAWKDPRGAVDALYLSVLSRFPSADERRGALDHARQPGVDRRAALIDLTWALLNSAEFLHRH